MATSAQSLLETFDKKVALSLLLPLYKLCNSNGKSATWSYVDRTQIIVNLLEKEKIAIKSTKSYANDVATGYFSVIMLMIATAL